MKRLCAIVLTHNESEHIQACLEAMAFADMRLVFDSYSTDNTPDLARDMGVTVLQHPFENFANQRNAALDAVAGQAEWVLFVDADERVTPELTQAVRRAIESEQYVGYRIPRHNYLFGKLTRGAGWYPDYQTRLLKVGKAHYDPARQVHEVVILDGAQGALDAHFLHYNYKNIAQFIAKQRTYVAYDAKILWQDGIRPKPQNYILQPLRHFWWRFITLKGYQDGLHGLRLSLLMAWYEGRKYVLLRGLWRTHATN
jgi:(heptosyl)LPS beta-1,4-glucosyltransferase